MNEKTKETYTLMHTMCPRSHEAADLELCELDRFKECKTCIIRRKGAKENDKRDIPREIH